MLTQRCERMMGTSLTRADTITWSSGRCWRRSGRLGWLVIIVKPTLRGPSKKLVKACVQRGTVYFTKNTLYNYSLIQTWLRVHISGLTTSNWSTCVSRYNLARGMGPLKTLGWTGRRSTIPRRQIVAMQREGLNPEATPLRIKITRLNK